MTPSQLSTFQLDKYKRADFGRCPRVLCQQQPLLPVGLTDVPYEKSVKLYCGRCEDLYSPKSSRHGSIDGAYFGTTFPHLLFLVYPTLIPQKSGPTELGTASTGGREAGEGRSRRRAREEQDVSAAEGVGEAISTASAALKADRYRPRIYGFQLNETAKLQRWQEAVRDRYIPRCFSYDINSKTPPPGRLCVWKHLRNVHDLCARLQSLDGGLPSGFSDPDFVGFVCGVILKYSRVFTSTQA